MAGPPEITAFCPHYHHAIEVIGRRWTGAIIRSMLAGNARFSAIAHTIPGLSDRLLSERLRELESEGIVERRARPESGRVEYRLTEKGRELAPVVEALSAWAERWSVADAPPAQAAASG